MAPIPHSLTPTVDAIYRQWETLNKEPPRTYLGASILGKECERQLWYYFRWVAPEQFTGRTLRIFDTGKREELRLLDDLRKAGVEVWDKDSRTGQQFRVTSHYGHVGGGMDAVLRGLTEAPTAYHVGECKTFNDARFNAWVKKGVKVSDPEYYCQVTYYMNHNEIDRSFVMGTNKNTDEIWSERVPLDKKDAERFNAKAERIVFASTPLPRISDDPAWHVCKMCPAWQQCHNKKGPALVSCRTCVHATPERDDNIPGRWTCALHKIDLTIANQREGCPHHRLIPALVPYAKQVDASEEENWIEYEVTHKGKTKRIRNGAHGVDSYTSAELSVAAPSAFFDEFAAQVRAELGGTLSGYQEKAA